MIRAFFLFLFLPAICLADAGFLEEATVPSGASPPVAAPCSTCGTCGGCTAADRICEDWDADNSCAWVEDYDAGVDDIDQVASHSGSFGCSDKGSYTLDITVDNTGDTMIQYDFGARESETYTQFYFNLVSETLEDGDDEDWLYLGQGGPATSAVVLEFNKSGSQMRVGYRYRSNSTWSTEYYGNITVGTWYRVRIYHDTTGEVTFQIDDTTVHTDASATVDRDWDTMVIGSTAGSATDTYRVQVDNIAVDITAAPGACPQ